VIRVLIIILGTVLAAACGEVEPATATKAAATTPAAKEVAPPPAKNPPPAAVETTDDALIATGPLIVENQLDLVAQREGIIVRVFADTGTRLKTGDLLVQLDDRQIRSELDATRARTRSIDADLKTQQTEEKALQADFNRTKEMWDSNLLPKEQFERAQFKLESASYEIRRVSELLTNSRETERGLELEIEKTQIRAPFEGVVARRYIRDGQSLAKGDRVFWFTAEGPLRLRFTVPEKYLGRLKNGQRFPMTSPSFPQEQHTARVIEISPVVDPASGTLEAMVELMGSPGNLRAGMSVSLRIEKLK